MRALKHRLMLVFALVALPPTLIGVIDAVQASQVNAQRLRDSVRNYAALASTYQHTLIENSTNLLLDISQSGGLLAQAGMPDPGVCTQTLGQAIRPYPVYVSLVALDRDGSAICGSDPARLPGNAADKEYFQQAVATKATFLSGYVMGSEPAIPILVLAQPVLTESAEVRSVLALAIRLDGLDASERFLRLPRNGVVYLLDRNGVMLHGATVPARLDDGGLPSASEISPARLRQSSAFEANARDGIMRVYAVSTLGSGSLFLLVGVPKGTNSGWVDRDLLTQILLVSAIWISGVLAAWLGTRLLVTRWTERLFEMTSALSKGDLSARADLRNAPLEIRQLGDTLAEMAARLETRQSELTAALDQKETMLREIHHRIKNNLQTVTSLLNLHSRGIKNDPAMQALQEVRIRVQALALVHRHLYENPEHQTVNARALLGELCQLIQVSSGVARTRVAITVDVASLDVEIDRAVPLALLVTELMTNALKHSFSDNHTGRITLRLAVVGDRDVELVVSDDGIDSSDGPATGQDVFAAQAPTLGMSLIRGFATQLGAEFRTQGPPGSSMLTIRFPLDRSAAEDLPHEEHGDHK